MLLFQVASASLCGAGPQIAAMTTLLPLLELQPESVHNSTARLLYRRRFVSTAGPAPCGAAQSASVGLVQALRTSHITAVQCGRLPVHHSSASSLVLLLSPQVGKEVLLSWLLVAVGPQ